MPTEKSMLDHINELVAEEKELRSSSHTHTDEDRARLRHLEEQLDQCWDMLRQRRARAEFDEPTDDVQERPVSPQDVLATLYRALGIPLDLHLQDASGRPVSIVGTGKPIEELS